MIIDTGPALPASACSSPPPPSGWRLDDEASGKAQELRHLGFVPLIVVDEVGYIPFDPDAAILTFSKPFNAWGEIFRDEVVARHGTERSRLLRLAPRAVSARRDLDLQEGAILNVTAAEVVHFQPAKVLGFNRRGQGGSSGPSIWTLIASSTESSTTR